MKKFHQQGLSLLELMIALALGLVLVAVAVQMFISSQANLSLQRSLGDLQDNGLFGIEFIGKDLRKTNLGAALPVIDANIAQGGIVFSNSNIVGNKNLVVENINNYISLQSHPQSVSGFTGHQSDQLTIQYKAVQNIYDDATFLRKINNSVQSDGTVDFGGQNTTVVGYDCEGRTITLKEVTEKTYIIQRYYVSLSNGSPALYCDAGRYKLSELEDNAEGGSTTKIIAIDGLGKNAQIVLRHVEHFRVLLGVMENGQTNNQKYKYMPMPDANNTVAQPQIPLVRSVKLGLMIRAQDRVTSNQLQDIEDFQILDLSLAANLLDSTKTKHMRQVLTQTIALRNGLGEDLRQ